MSKISYRHQYILEQIKEKGSVEVDVLSQELKVSGVTIRKDLTFLEDKGLLYRTHGGAIKKNPYINEQPVSEKEHIHAYEKEIIAKAGADLVESNDTIIIASGTSVLALSKKIKPQGRLTVISASLNVSLELSRYENVDIFQLGGALRKSSYSVVGPYGEDFLELFSCNKFFLGIDGLDMKFGLTTTSLREAKLNKKMIDVAEKVIVLADSSKFGKRGFGKICDIDQVDVIITDNKIPKYYQDAFKKLDIKVIIAE